MLEIIIILILVGIIAICVAIGVAIGKAKQNKYLNAGKIIKRKTEFWDEEETFVCAVSYDAIVNAVRATNYAEDGITVNFFNNRITFEAYGWDSSLDVAGNAGDKYVYKYSVHSYRTRKGMIRDPLRMNIVLTSVEKMFLSLDPTTTLETHKIKRTTRTL